MSRMLITRPYHDSTTAYLFKWSECLVDAAGKQGISCSDFAGPKASRSEVEKYLHKQNPSLVVFNGHGSDDTIFGHKNEVLIQSGDNEHLLNSKTHRTRIALPAGSLMMNLLCRFLILQTR